MTTPKDEQLWQFSRDPKPFRLKNGMPEFMPKQEALNRINRRALPLTEQGSKNPLHFDDCGQDGGCNPDCEVNTK